ncbi:MmcQ/YjbR family DNA-binding protein [Streptococcus ovuberis]|uniref:MmcQ family protein n=1 Tax=Streptococcus ovuberis TaxID=1936207 RepID=A0A7X6N241_9STRE|nr:MmcQ/YjbR family DNA-binding protein [Streptococcus ovuberis]NKZ20709.1 MmcQ family protein [Streptococcus ovuberis]
MVLEEQIFQAKTFDKAQLLAFGFEKRSTQYCYRERILEGQFEAHIQITEQGQLSGQLIDTDLDEEYTAFRTNQVGAFVGQVREAYQELLERIAGACCQENALHSPQGQRLEAHLSASYNDSPEEFGRFKGIFTFRHPANQKWYALAMAMPFGKLDLGPETYSKDQLDATVEVLNLKIHPEDKERLLAKPGIYPSYHMNKTHWVTVVLNDEVPDEELFALVADSRQLVAQGKGQTEVADGYWLIPANPKLYDIDQEFSANRFVSWPQKKGIGVGHKVYIYLTAPYRCLRYACRVVELRAERQEMVLECFATFSDNQFPITFLQEHGIKAIRSTRRMTPGLVKALKADKL